MPSHSMWRSAAFSCHTGRCQFQSREVTATATGGRGRSPNRVSTGGGRSPGVEQWLVCGDVCVPVCGE